MSLHFNPRDITWLAFNERVLQEAMDEKVPLHLRIRFLGIFSNNLDEFFRVRVAGLKRAMDFKEKVIAESFYQPPSKILQRINEVVMRQQLNFDKTWKKIQTEMAEHKVYIKNAKNLTAKQKEFVRTYFDEVVESNVIPILLHENTPMPYLRDKSLYLGVAMRKKDWQYSSNYAIIEIPSRFVGRFVLLPTEDPEEKNVMLLEDVITFNLPHIFSYFGYDEFAANAFKVTKDAELDLDNDIRTNFAEKIEKGLKNRRKGKPTRFVFDKDMDKALLELLIRKLNLTKKDSIIPGGKIHNFKHFMDFPDVFEAYARPVERTSFTHQAFEHGERVTDVILKEDVLLTFPYHKYNPVIDLLREAAMDPDVKSIQITAYRLASSSKIINALIYAARNGKEVTVMLELQARFDEESNLEWKDMLEPEGITVLVGLPNKKVHAKLCVIKKRAHNKTIQYGFVSTGNFNEKTARIYGDHLLLTSDRGIMADINKVFNVLKKPKDDFISVLKTCKNLLVCPQFMREKIVHHIDKEIEEAKAGRKAEIIVKVNSLSDRLLIEKLYDAATVGVTIKLIVRGIYCAVNQKEFKEKIKAISIVDEYLEHARVMYFYNKGSEDLYISSADWMTRNLDYRIEAAAKITDKNLKKELKDILDIQLRDNVKARILDKKLSNEYIRNDKKECRSQIETYIYLKAKTNKK
ncbi:polyphosphate kinase 1 [Chryseobacterium indologenes]|uniref:Polyphosphate kinase n=1 Tax=Chryseobacterium indologenes TaxID=253 RepID=A0AAD1DWA5_CHRID|nr:polyphosphate kinase 1 [Chryseobacterium indologenes]ATN06207.1 polyphosphate kinase 1 [Chryseobacterium indologenes]AVK73274.1 polyphosphate kinase 1 [Chryseobacterium indologenes]AYY85032.1 polyphosphate kinase 1 [Chryseobacterium indologenes]AYZ34703.1 polyphosphate kinase 1 [Chryseobacterium indologenes]AZB18087.1 polyphosphate kinase 1 [Chryseobacterium indologenes]